MDQFEKAGYGTEGIGFGEKAAVLVVDFQKGFTDPDSPLGGSPHVQAAVDKTAILLQAAKTKAVPIASCRVAWKGREDMSYWKISTLYEGNFYYGHPHTEFDPRVSDPDYNFEFTKTAPSIFFRTPLDTYLTKQRVDTVIITGCTTSGCVRASIVDAFSYGYRVIVPADCCGDQDDGPHWDNLRDVGRRYADVVKLDDVLSHINALPLAKSA